MILIISAENDDVTNEICVLLTLQKKDFIRINETQCITDVFFDFKARKFDFTINNNISYCLNDISTVYYRNGTIFFKNFPTEIDPRVRQFFNSELSSIRDFIYNFLIKNCTKIYGNLVTRSVNKLEVLSLAQDLDFKIPETYIFSKTYNLELKLDDKGFITKSISEMMPVFHENDLYLNYTKEISVNEIVNIKDDIIPTLIQEKISVEFEVRVFFFEMKIWAIAMFDFTGNIDVRNVASKKYIPYDVPQDICEKIMNIAQSLKLKCGTIDLLKTENDFYFLEINPLGQFQDLNYWGNYKIDQYIAELL